MNERFRELHRAECSECGQAVRIDDTGYFIHPFYLSRFCPYCGEDMCCLTNHDESTPHWRHVIVKEKRIEPVKTINPLTWFRLPKWEIVSRHSMKAG